jgi:WD40 repeat protein
MGTGMAKAIDACIGPEEPINDAPNPPSRPWVHPVVPPKDVSPILPLGN